MLRRAIVAISRTGVRGGRAQSPLRAMDENSKPPIWLAAGNRLTSSKIRCASSTTPSSHCNAALKEGKKDFHAEQIHHHPRGDRAPGPYSAQLMGYAQLSEGRVEKLERRGGASTAPSPMSFRPAPVMIPVQIHRDYGNSSLLDAAPAQRNDFFRRARQPAAKCPRSAGRQSAVNIFRFTRITAIIIPLQIVIGDDGLGIPFRQTR